MWGFVVLSAASLLAGVAWSEASLNAGRALQGLGSALIAPAALTLVLSTFSDPKELNKALGFWGAAAAAGGSAGVFLGGALIEWLSWHWVFIINIPLGLLVLFLSPKLLLKGSTRKGKVDILGAILATGAFILTVFTIVSSESAAWVSLQTIGLLLLAVVLFTFFLGLQKRKKEPLVPLSIFKAPNLSAGSIVMALLAGAWIPLWFYLNLYLQQVLDFSALNSGLALLPMTIAIMILMVGVTGKLVAKFGFKPILISGMILLTASLILFSTVPVEGSFLANVLPASLLGALGISLAYIPGTIASISGAKPEETGLASGLVTTSYQIGSALGLAIIVAIAAAKTEAIKMEGITDVASLNEGFQTAFIAAALISGLGVLVAIFSVKTFKK
jgi:MFS family permease